MVGFIEGTTFTDDDLRGSGTSSGGRGLPAAARGPVSLPTSTCSRSSALPCASCRARVPAPARYLEFADKVEQIKRAFASSRRPTVPCNNDLFAGNFIDDGDEALADRLRVLRQQRRLLRARQHLERSHLTVDQLEALMEAYDGRLLRHRVARARLWGLMAKYGWTLWGSIQHS